MVPDQRFELRLLGSEPRFLPLEDSGMAPQVGVAPTYLRLTAGFTTIDDTVERKLAETGRFERPRDCSPTA